MNYFLCVLAVFISVTATGQTSYPNSRYSSDEELIASVDRNIAVAGIKSIEYLESKKYLELINHIESLTKKFNDDVKEELPLTWEIYSIYYSRKDLRLNLDDFVSKYPDSFIPYLLRGTYYTGQGWIKRGGNYISDTDNKQINGMDYFHFKAYPDLNNAISLNPKFMHSYLIRAAIFRPRSLSENMWSDMQSALSLKPTSFDAWSEYLNASLPRWYGSDKILKKRLLESQQFVDENPRLLGMKALVAKDDGEKDWYANRQRQALKKYIAADELGDHVWVTSEVARVLLDLSFEDKESCKYTDKAIKLEPYGWRTNRFAIYCDSKRKLGFLSNDK